MAYEGAPEPNDKTEVLRFKTARDIHALSNGGASSGLTDAQLRATPVPVSMAQDIEIGAVELKDAGTDTRANILAANTARTTGTPVVAVQHVGADGKVGGADGADATQGTTTDAPVADNTTVASATAATGIALWKRLVNLGIAILAKLPTVGTAGTASANVITVQGIASGTAQPASVADGSNAVEGVTTGAAVITDANGTIQQYLRGLIKQWIAGTLVVGAGENVIGKTVGVSTLVTSTITMSVAGAYATGDYIGTTTTPQAFLLASRTNGGMAWIKSIRISDKNTTAAVAMELWLFSVTFVAPTDNAAWAISDAEAFTCLGVIPIGTGKWYASSNNKVFSDDTISLAIKPGVTSLFYALVARGTTPSWTSGDLDIGLGILQD